MFKQIGQETLFTFNLEEGWTKAKLFKQIMDKLSTYAPNSENPKGLERYRSFYLKIYGDYDKSIVPSSPKCASCPDNRDYERFNDYNQLRDDKIKVLVLRSDYPDFRSYDIYAAYYSNNREQEAVKQFNIEYCADPWTFKWAVLRILGLAYI